MTHSHRGVVVEIDENKVLGHFPEIGFGDVDYQDETSEGLLYLLHRAYRIGKYRYHYMLQSGVFSVAYYTKHTCWSYEKERRLIAGENYVEQENGINLLKLPVDCVTGIISGHNSTTETQNTVDALVDDLDITHYRMKIGKSSSEPYFVNHSDDSHEFRNGNICRCDNTCDVCNEPTDEENDICSWCGIEQQHRTDAAQQNPMRMLDRLGLIKEYYENMNQVGKKK